MLNFVFSHLRFLFLERLKSSQPWRSSCAAPIPSTSLHCPHQGAELSPHFRVPQSVFGFSLVWFSRRISGTHSLACLDELIPRCLEVPSGLHLAPNGTRSLQMLECGAARGPPVSEPFRYQLRAPRCRRPSAPFHASSPGCWELQWPRRDRRQGLLAEGAAVRARASHTCPSEITEDTGAWGDQSQVPSNSSERDYGSASPSPLAAGRRPGVCGQQEGMTGWAVGAARGCLMGQTILCPLGQTSCGPSGDCSRNT